MESPHILAGLFGANENGCRVSGNKNGEGGGSKDTRARILKEGGDGEERVGQKRVRGGPKRDGEREARKMEATARLGGEEGTIW